MLNQSSTVVGEVASFMGIPVFTAAAGFSVNTNAFMVSHFLCIIFIIIGGNIEKTLK